MTSQLKHCEDGQTLEDSKTYEESLETARRKRPRSATSESVRSINEVTLNDGLQTSDSTSAILAQGPGNKGIVTLLEQIHAGGIEEVVVTRKV